MNGRPTVLMAQKKTNESNNGYTTAPAATPQPHMYDKNGSKHLDRNEERQLSVMLAKHRTDTLIQNNLNNEKHIKAELETIREDHERTTSITSILSYGSVTAEEEEVMSKKYKYVTASVLWFCYFSLALNDYIFGPTLAELADILGTTFEMISYFVIIRQVSYTFGALGGVAFNYVNRQLALIILLIISAFTLVATPYSGSLNVFFIIGAINGFAAGACDIGFHVWIIEMFEGGGGPLLQALHFSFGIGITIAPSITAAFISSEGGCGEDETVEANDGTRDLTTTTTTTVKPKIESLLYIPYLISAGIVAMGGIALLALFIYKKYQPPRLPHAPPAFAEEMPTELSTLEKFQIWKENIPSSYTMTLIVLGSFLLLAYYGLEVTYFQFMAQFITSTPLPIYGTMSALVETATGAAYAIGGGISIYLSIKLRPDQMIYFNFLIINIGCILLIIFYTTQVSVLWIGNILVGLGFSSTYATAYTFLEHHISVTNAIGSLFVLAGGAGTAILPLFLQKLCENSSSIIIMCFVCTEISAIIFGVLHFMTTVRSKEIDVIKKKLINNPAILLGYREKSLSILTI
ncbi:sodium-dependent glucose transporter 1B-like [Oppia nitens]|uniref:sodium-dependent glucose transporter 1B-like n=1 Tax=Oppia nitens TaxID=1686743 RepID=UPI0023DAE98C|nr:sodium-dependent glucose transporter 1B-like [Oppia nitens]